MAERHSADGGSIPPSSTTRASSNGRPPVRRTGDDGSIPSARTGSSSNGKIPRLAREGCGFDSRRLHLHPSLPLWPIGKGARMVGGNEQVRFLSAASVPVVKRTITLVYEASVAGSNPAGDALLMQVRLLPGAPWLA